MERLKVPCPVRRLAVAGRDPQRIGLSATVGNPTELRRWLQGAAADAKPGKVLAPEVVVAAPPAVASGSPAPIVAARAAPGEDVELDYVGSVGNAAQVVAALRARGVTTFLSHASLSVDERRRSEQAFAGARGCVIVATSTLELRIDVDDLDHVIQINAPGSVAGRTGRRAGTVRSCLFLTLSDEALIRAAGLLLLWSRGWVEPVSPDRRDMSA